MFTRSGTATPVSELSAVYPRTRGASLPLTLARGAPYPVPKFWYDHLPMSNVSSARMCQPARRLSLRRLTGSERRLRLTVAVAVAFLAGGCDGRAPAVEPEPVLEAEVPDTQSTLGDVVGLAPEGDAIIRSIVLLDPHHEVDVPLPEVPPVMDQIGRQFVPGFILVRAGQTIDFTNSEDDLHTVHVKDSAGESIFNVASINGSSYTHTFEMGDEFTVECNTHTEMFADIMVVESPYAVVAERDGRFTVPGVVPGRYTATVIIGKERRTGEVEIAAGPNELDLADL